MTIRVSYLAVVVLVHTCIYKEFVAKVFRVQTLASAYMHIHLQNEILNPWIKLFNKELHLNMDNTKFIIFIALLCLGTVNCMQTNEVTPKCGPSESICEFNFEIYRKQTMLYYDGTLATPIVSRDGIFYKRPKCTSDDTNVQATQEGKIVSSYHNVLV